MIKPLIISREYLMDHSPTGECVRAFVGAMKSCDWAPTVYSSDKAPQIKDSRSFKSQVIHESNWPQYLAAAVRRLLLPDLTWLPGYEWWSWGKRCKKQILNNIKIGKLYDYIHTVSFPCACHTIGLQLKRETGLPWIAQFYDPWADNPYRPFKTMYYKKKDWALEREVVENADLIIHDNEPIAQLWRERYGEEIANKIVVLPLTVPLPSTVVSESTHKNGDVLTISHIGNFMLNRTSIPFINALLQLFNNKPELKEKLKVNFIGNVTEQEKEMIKKHNLANVFNIVGSLSPNECEPYYHNTDVFLAIDGVNKNNLFFPSKILKYFFFQRPILGITPKGSVLDYELKASGHAVFDNEDTEDIKNHIDRLITYYSSAFSFDKNYWRKFNPDTVIEEYQTIVRERLLNK